MQSLNKGVTPTRGIRVPDETWHLFKALAEYQGDTASSVIREALEKYTADYEGFTVDVDGAASYRCSACRLVEHEDTFELAAQSRDEFNGLCSYCANGVR